MSTRKTADDDGDILDLLYERGKQRASRIPEFDVERTISRARAAHDAGAVNFWIVLNPTERRAFESASHKQTFAPGTALMREGERADEVIVILEGWTVVCLHEDRGLRRLYRRVSRCPRSGEEADVRPGDWPARPDVNMLCRVATPSAAERTWSTADPAACSTLQVAHGQHSVSTATRACSSSSASAWKQMRRPLAVSARSVIARAMSCSQRWRWAARSAEVRAQATGVGLVTAVPPEKWNQHQSASLLKLA